MSRYTPKKKKISGPRIIGAMKYVRIDFRTEIMVPVDVPDEIARERYIERLNRGIRDQYKPIPDVKDPEISVGSLEEMQIAITENTELRDDD